MIVNTSLVTTNGSLAGGATSGLRQSWAEWPPRFAAEHSMGNALDRRSKNMSPFRSAVFMSIGAAPYDCSFT